MHNENAGWAVKAFPNEAWASPSGIRTAAWLLLVLFLANKLLGWLRRPAVKRRFERVTGLILVGFGARLLLF